MSERRFEVEMLRPAEEGPAIDGMRTHRSGSWMRLEVQFSDGANDITIMASGPVERVKPLVAYVNNQLAPLAKEWEREE